MDATNAAGRACPPKLCSFDLAGARLGLDVALVGEVVHVDAVTPVPLSDPAVRGVFVLRGVPIALLDLTALLGLSRDEAQPTGSAIVLRTGSLIAALGVDRVESVVQLAGNAFVPATEGAEHAIVSGFLEQPGDTHPLTVLDADALLSRVDRLRYAAAT